MKKKELINEIMGVPTAIDKWVGYVSEMVVSTVDVIISRDKWEGSEIEWRGNQYTMYEGAYQINGKEFTNMLVDIHFDGDMFEFLKSETFKNLPLYNPKLTVELCVLPDVVFEGGNYGKNFEATQSYTSDDLANIQLKKLGKATIFPKNELLFIVNIPFSFISEKNNDHEKNLFNTLTPVVGHELTHIYQTYRQLLGGKKTIGFGKETILNVLPQKLKISDMPTWNRFLHIMYLSLSFEVNARVPQLYYSMKQHNATDKESALKFLKTSEPWKDYQMLKGFNSKEFMDKFESEMGDNVYGKLIEQWDLIIRDAQVHLKKMGIEIPFMEKVPENVKNNPIKFFEFFEKRFQYKADKMKKKLSKVVNMVIQEGQE